MHPASERRSMLDHSHSVLLLTGSKSSGILAPIITTYDTKILHPSAETFYVRHPGPCGPV